MKQSHAKWREPELPTTTPVQAHDLGRLYRQCPVLREHHRQERYRALVTTTATVMLIIVFLVLGFGQM